MENKLNVLNLLSSTTKVLKFKQTFILLFLFLTFSLIAENTYSQEKIDLKLKNAGLEEALKQIIKKTDYQILYKTSDVSSVTGLDFTFKKAGVEEILDKCLENTKLTYKLREKTIVIRPKTTANEKKEKVEVSGRIIDEYGNSLPGATVMEAGTFHGTTTDPDGLFKIDVTNSDAVLEISFMGFAEASFKIVILSILSMSISYTCSTLASNPSTINNGWLASLR